MKTNPIGSFLLLLAILAISLFILHMPMVVEALITLAVLNGLHSVILFVSYQRRTIRPGTPGKLVTGKHKTELHKQRA